MVKTSAREVRQAKQKPTEVTVRQYEPDEFEADTAEERPVALLAERRRQFVAGLEARQVGTALSVN